jgi:hypothetical protein
LNSPLVKGEPVKINGKVYANAVNASRALGVSTNVIYKLVKKLNSTRLSSLTETIKVLCHKLQIKLKNEET